MSMTRFEKIFKFVKEVGLPTPPPVQSVKIINAKENLTGYMSHILSQQNKTFQWLPEYGQVAAWMADSGGKSLLLYGNCGRGKTMIARFVIPALFYMSTKKLFTCVDAIRMAENPDSILRCNFVSVDDVGTEDFTNNYGARRCAFAELVDSAEKDGKIVIATTNLNKKQLAEKYGDRTVDRIRSSFNCVLFKGDSLR